MTQTTQTKNAAKPDAGAFSAAEMLDNISRANKNPDWLITNRRESLECFAGTALPSRIKHLWRYTDPKLFLQAENSFASHTGNEVVGAVNICCKALGGCDLPGKDVRRVV